MTEPSDRPQKVFTVSEANELLPTIVPLVEQLQGIYHSIEESNQQVKTMTDKLSQGNGNPIRSIQVKIEELTKHQLHLIDAFQSALDQLESMGCLLKDLRNGLVDFYAFRESAPILLCWKLGEERVGFWHSLEEGYAGRQPLE